MSGEPCAKVGVPRFLSAAEGSARCVSKGMPLQEAGVLLWGPRLWCCRENRGLERGSFVCPVPLLAPSRLCFNLTLPFQGTWLALDGPARAGTWPGLRRARQGDGARGWSIPPGEGRRCRQTPSPADGRAQVGVSCMGPPTVHVKSKKPILAVWLVRLPAAR